MKLTHFTHKPLKFKTTKQYSQINTINKPRGFWLSDESQTENCWSYWCLGNEFGSLEYSTLFQLDLSQILILDTASKVTEFTLKYQQTCPLFSLFSSIDWPTIATQYKGILITPYSTQINISWYTTLDCSSACIWDLSALTQVGNSNKTIFI